MPALRPRPDLDQLRRQARDLLRAVKAGDPDAQRRLAAFAVTPTLAGAQLVLAREHGHASWRRLKAAVEEQHGRAPAFVLRRIASVTELQEMWRVLARIIGSERPPPPHWQVFEDYAAARTAYLVIEHEGEVVGGAVGLHLLALDSSARGLGLGRRLVQTVEAELLDRGVPLGLHADPDNVAFFLALGYSQRGKSQRLMSKGAPVSPALLGRRLARWRDRAGDLEAGVVLAVDPTTGKVPPLPW